MKTLMIGAGAVLISVAGGVAAEQWALAGVDRFYFNVSDVKSPVREIVNEPPAATYSPMAVAYPTYPTPISASSAARFEEVDAPAIDPWLAKMEAEERHFEAELRRERRRAQAAEAQSDQPVPDSQVNRPLPDPVTNPVSTDEPTTSQSET